MFFVYLITVFLVGIGMYLLGRADGEKGDELKKKLAEAQDNVEIYSTLTEEIAEKLHNKKAELKEAQDGALLIIDATRTANTSLKQKLESAAEIIRNIYAVKDHQGNEGIHPNDFRAAVDEWLEKYDG